MTGLLGVASEAKGQIDDDDTAIRRDAPAPRGRVGQAGHAGASRMRSPGRAAHGRTAGQGGRDHESVAAHEDGAQRRLGRAGVVGGLRHASRRALAARQRRPACHRGHRRPRLAPDIGRLANCAARWAALLDALPR